MIELSMDGGIVSAKHSFPAAPPPTQEQHEIMVLGMLFVTTICLLYDTTAFQVNCNYNYYGHVLSLDYDAVGNRRRRVGSVVVVALRRSASASDDSKSSANLRDRLYQKRLEELHEYRKLHGHGSIPTPFPLPICPTRLISLASRLCPCAVCLP